jgi:hypothetical protein
MLKRELAQLLTTLPREVVRGVAVRASYWGRPGSHLSRIRLELMPVHDPKRSSCCRDSPNVIRSVVGEDQGERANSTEQAM